MKNPNPKFTSLVASLLAVIAVLILPPTVNGQSGNRNQAPQVPGSPKPGDEQRPASLRERQFRMMEMEREAASQPLSPEEEKLATAQIAEDYKQIQVINNKMMGAAIPAAAPNYAHIAETLGEIRRRAIRLKDNLGLAKLEVQESAKGKRRQALTAADIKVDLLSLDNSIMHFVQNPIFKNTEVVNVEEATKARKDLEFIIVNSQHISRDAERLKKSTEQPR